MRSDLALTWQSSCYSLGFTSSQSLTEWISQMKLYSISAQKRLKQAATSLIEVLVALAVMGIVFISLYAGFSSGFGIIQLARENLRGTQIMLEKMETIRLYTWTQINSNGFIPNSFTNYYDPNRGSASGVEYHGRLTITDSPITADYGRQMKQVRVEVEWMCGTVQRRREMTTLISRYGLQNYIY